MENLTCKICDKQVSENFNFCPHCGGAITDIAKRLNKEKCDIIRLKLLNELTEKVSDKKSLQILNQTAQKISK
jgi:uncharacterized membrane protein YvbJ